jgi:hypothetical protein
VNQVHPHRQWVQQHRHDQCLPAQANPLLLLMRASLPLVLLLQALLGAMYP